MKKELFKDLEYFKVSNNASSAIVLFHGYGASMHDLYPMHEYLGKSCDYYFPNGYINLLTNSLTAIESRAWFNIDINELEQAMMQGRFRDFSDKSSEELDEAIFKMNDFICELSSRYDNIILGGFSQGAMLATHLCDTFKLKALIILSGTLIDKNNLLLKLDKSEEVISFFQSHGREDALLEYSQAINLFELLKLYKLQGEFISFDGGHEIPLKVLTKLGEFLKNLKLT